MNLNKTILDAFDPEIAERFVSRREAVTKLGKLGAGFALASIPVSLGLFSTASFGKGNNPQAVNDVLNFALTLEYLESEFYNMGLAASGLLNNPERAVFAQIAKHENAHVAFLKGALGSAAVAKPQFDFTAGGNFPDVFTNSQTFTALAQGFEDTGVRAYKGQAENLMSDDLLLTAALQIHSVEARHAAEVRRLRGKKGWITNNETDVQALAAVYAGDEIVTQGGVNLVTLTGLSAARVSEAFDEPMAMNDVLAIAGLFIK